MQVGERVDIHTTGSGVTGCQTLNEKKSQRNCNIFKAKIRSVIYEKHRDY
jgi:hypothetical protein